MTEHGAFHWNELMTHNVDAAKDFYANTLGWSYEAFPMNDGTYWVAMCGGKPVGGLMSMKGVTAPDTPPHWFCHLAVDDVDARVAKVAEAGGTVMREPFDVPKVGRIAIVQDTTGAMMGWITPAPMAD